MNLKCMINGIEYETIPQGNTFSEEFNETLDSGTIIIAHVKKINDILPYDDVYIYDNSIEGPNNFYRHLLINNFTYERINATDFSSGEIYYNYKIDLFSETKGLETIQLPNISITQPIEFGNRGTISGDVRTVWFYLKQFVDMYGTKIKVLGKYKDEFGNGFWEYKNKYILDENLKDTFDNVYAPSFSLNNPNLRDVLSQLMIVKDMIPYVQDNVIKGLDISKRTGSFDDKSVTKISGSRTSENHCDGLKRTYNNALSQENTCKTVEFLGFRNSNNAVMTLENMRLETRFPVYKINKIYMCYYKKGTVNKSLGGKQDAVFLCKQDITPLVKLNSERQLLSRDWDEMAKDEPKTVDEMAQYKMCTVGYDIGSRYITGWGEKYSYIKNGISWWDYKKTYVENMAVLMDKIYPMGIYYRKYFENVGGMTEDDVFNPNRNGFFEDYINPFDGNNFLPEVAGISTDVVGLKGLFFIVEYEGFFNGTIIHSKDDARNDIIMNDNSSASLTILEKDGLFQKEKVNRFGNEAVVIQARYNSIDDLQEIGTVYEDDIIIYHREYAIYDNFISATYYGTKDYVLKNYFTTVFSKHRPYNLLSYEESVIRAENKKMFLIFSKDELYFEKENKIFDFDVSKILSFFTQNPKISADKNFLSYPEKINYGYIVVNKEKYASDINTFVSGDSLCFNMSMYDNVSGGVYISVREPVIKVVDDVTQDYSGSIQDWYMTVDSIKTGFLQKAGFYFSHKITDEYLENSIAINSDSNTIDNIIENIRSEVYSKIFYLPKILDSNIKEENIIGTDLVINKDNKEVINITYQIEPISYDKNFIFSPWMMKLCDLLSIYDKFNEDNYVNTTTDETQYEVYNSTFIYQKGISNFVIYMPFILIKMSKQQYENLKSLGEEKNEMDIDIDLNYNITADSNYYEPYNPKDSEHYEIVNVYNFHGSKLSWRGLYEPDVVNETESFILKGELKINNVLNDDYNNIIFYRKNKFEVDDAVQTLSYINFHEIFGTTDEDTVYFVNCQIEGINEDFGPILKDFSTFKLMSFMATNEKQLFWDKNHLTGELDPTINNQIKYNLDSYFEKNILSNYDAVAQEEKLYKKNLFVVLGKNVLEKHMVYNEYSNISIINDLIVTDLKATDVFSLQKENVIDEAEDFIQIDLTNLEINDDIKSVQLWYYVNGSYKFVVGSNISDEDKTNKKIKIYVSILGNKDSRVFERINNKWIPKAKVMNYLEDKTYIFGKQQRYQNLGEKNVSSGFEYTLLSSGSDYSITSIGTCEDENILMPDYYYEYPITEIGNKAFYNKEIESIKISDFVKKIDAYAFSNCENLKNIIFDKNSQLETIEAHAFENCKNLMSLNIPDKVKTMGNMVFKKSGLTSIEIPKNTTELGEYLFTECYNLTDAKIFSKIEKINNYCFYECSKLLNFDIPDSVTEIGYFSFAGCTSLKDVEISDKIELIDESAFENCSNIEKITILKNVLTIEKNAFKGCSNLEIYCEYESKPETWHDNWNPDDRPVYWDYKENIGLNFELKEDNTYELKSLGLCEDTYIFVPIYYNDILITSIGESAFEGENIEKLKISRNINVIKEFAFANMKNLKIVKIEKGLKEIQERAFTLDENLTSIEIPDGVTSIGKSAFDGCSSLTTIIIPFSVTNIEKNAFYDCPNLTIYCEASEKPEGWDTNWNPDDRPVTWGYTSE